MDQVEAAGRRVVPIQAIVEYGEFGGGEFGVIGAAKAPENTYESKNMIMYRNGWFGPRMGATSLDYEDLEVGEVLGMGWRGTSGADLWWIQGEDVWYAESNVIGDTAAKFTGDLDSAPTLQTQYIEWGDRFTYFTSYGDGTYVLDHVTFTCTKVTDAPGCRGIAWYGERLCVAGSTGNTNRIFFSEVGDPNDWSGGGFLDIPTVSGSIVGLWTQRGHLSVLTQNGEWWIVTNAIGTDAEVVRRVSGGGVHPWNSSAEATAILGSDNIIQVPLNSDYPAWFNGSTVTEERSVTINATVAQQGEGTVKVIRGFRPDEAMIVFPGTGNFALYLNSVWTFHHFDVGTELAPVIPVISKFFVSDGQGRIMFTDGGAEDAEPEFYVLVLNVHDRPGFSTDPQASPADLSDGAFEDCYVYFPEFQRPDFREHRLHQVVVDFEEFDCGSTVECTFTVDAITRDLYRIPDISTGEEACTAQTYSLFPDDWTTGEGDGRRKRKVFGFGTDSRYGSSVQLRIYDVANVVIRRVQMVTEMRTGVPYG
jgi:hypothetical protein